MYDAPNKKMLNILILRILEEQTDENHHLTQNEIVNILKDKYQLECDRRAVARNIASLKAMDYCIEHNSGYFIRSGIFTDTELRMLIDTVYYSKMFSADMAKLIINKLKSMGSEFFRSSVSNISMPSSIIRTDSEHIIASVSAISKAIKQNCKISFRYNSYGTDLKIRDRGRDYIMNPYRMIVANGHYYLLGNLDKYDDVSYYRIDKMSRVEILDEKCKQMKEVSGLEKGLDIPDVIARNIYMLQGESSYVKLKCRSNMMDELVDWFGKNIKVMSEDKTTGDIVVRVSCNHKAMMYWAMQNGLWAEVLEPLSLRKEIAAMSREVAEKYSDTLNPESPSN